MRCANDDNMSYSNSPPSSGAEPNVHRNDTCSNPDRGSYSEGPRADTDSCMQDPVREDSKKSPEGPTGGIRNSAEYHNTSDPEGTQEIREESVHGTGQSKMVHRTVPARDHDGSTTTRNEEALPNRGVQKDNPGSTCEQETRNEQRQRSVSFVQQSGLARIASPVRTDQMDCETEQGNDDDDKFLDEVEESVDNSSTAQTEADLNDQSDRLSTAHFLPSDDPDQFPFSILRPEEFQPLEKRDSITQPLPINIRIQVPPEK